MRLRRADLSISKTFPSGMLVITAVGYPRRRYMGYTKREAIARYMREFK